MSTCVVAARRFLSSASPAALRVRDVELLLSDYRLLSSVGLAAVEAQHSRERLQQQEQQASGKDRGEEQGPVKDNEQGHGQEGKGVLVEEPGQGQDEQPGPVQEDEQGGRDGEGQAERRAPDGPKRAEGIDEAAGDTASDSPDQAPDAASPSGPPPLDVDADSWLRLFCAPTLVLPGRFCHVAAGGVRLSDVPLLQQDYAQVLALHALVPSVL